MRVTQMVLTNLSGDPQIRCLFERTNDVHFREQTKDYVH